MTDERGGNLHTPGPNETRDQLANVRTFLAWVRTAITIMAFGFVVAKFGILLRQLPGNHVHSGELHFATVIGSALVLFGGFFLVLATWEYLRIRRGIEKHLIYFSARTPVILAGILIVMALSMAVYIWVTASV